MINRRKMFGFAAVLPLAAAGVAANNAPTQAATSNKEDAPDGTAILQLRAKKIKQHRSDNPYTISLMSYEDYGPQLGISVGKDGHMWLKINDEWKRVIVE